MLLPIYSPLIICGVLIITGAVSAEDVKKAVGGEISFTPAKFATSVTSITWKQKANDSTVKVIEWDVEDGVTPPPNPRFQGITTLNDKTGQITITNLKVEHSGLYTIDINSKEQGQRFNLEVIERVPKPVITKEESSNSAVVYLRCEYSEEIIWKNSSGVKQEGQKNHLPGQFIVVKNTQNPGNFYTCTLKNDVSEETSASVYERDLFHESNAGPIAGIVIPIIIFILLIIAFIACYLLNKSFRNRVNTFCQSALNSVNCLKKQDPKPAGENQGADMEKIGDGHGEPMKDSDQKNAKGNPDSKVSEGEDANKPLLEEEGHDKAAEDQNNAESYQDPTASETEAVYVLEKNGANPEHEYSKIIVKGS